MGETHLDTLKNGHWSREWTGGTKWEAVAAAAERDAGGFRWVQHNGR